MLMTNTEGTAVGGVVEKSNDAIRQTATAIGSIGSKLATGAAATEAAGSVLDMAKDPAGKVSSTASQTTEDLEGTYDKANETLAKGREQAQRTLDDAQKLVADTRPDLKASRGNSLSSWRRSALPSVQLWARASRLPRQSASTWARQAGPRPTRGLTWPRKSLTRLLALSLAPTLARKLET
jgi:ABC-type transporter Mla subunit MlaD